MIDLLSCNRTLDIVYPGQGVERRHVELSDSCNSYQEVIIVVTELLRYAIGVCLSPSMY